MAGLPVFVGAVQLTLRLVGVAWAAVTVGASGLAGGSSTSVTVMMSVVLVDNVRAAAPLVAVMVTTYSLSLASFAGVVLCASVGFS